MGSNQRFCLWRATRYHYATEPKHGLVFLLGWTLGDVKRLFAGSTELREGSQSQILIVVLRFESGQLPFCAKRQQNARSGNRTRVASVAGMHHTTRPTTLMSITRSWCCKTKPFFYLALRPQWRSTSLWWWCGANPNRPSRRFGGFRFVSVLV